VGGAVGGGLIGNAITHGSAIGTLGGAAGRRLRRPRHRQAQLLT